MLNGVDLTDVKALAIISSATLSTGTGTEKYFVMARNIGGLTNAEAIEDWVIETINPELFTKQ